MAQLTRGAAEIRWFAERFDRFPSNLRSKLRRELRGIGQRALFSVRAQAAWSTRIPRATRLKIGISKTNPGLAIEVDRFRAPHARPYENNDRDGYFRAPLFGDRSRWFSHPARPFLVRGARPWFETTDREVIQAVGDAAREAGFRG